MTVAGRIDEGPNARRFRLLLASRRPTVPREIIDAGDKSQRVAENGAGVTPNLHVSRDA